MGVIWLSSESEGDSCSSETLLVCGIMQSFMWALLLTGAILTLIRFVHAWCVLRCCPSRELHPPCAPLQRPHQPGLAELPPAPPTRTMSKLHPRVSLCSA